MNNYSHVLLATDFSELSRVAVRRGLLEARAHAARATLVHVIEHFPDVVPHYWIAPEDIDPTTYYRGQGAQELARFLDWLTASPQWLTWSPNPSSPTPILVGF